MVRPAFCHCLYRVRTESLSVAGRLRRFEWCTVDVLPRAQQLSFEIEAQSYEGTSKGGANGYRPARKAPCEARK